MKTLQHDVQDLNTLVLEGKIMEAFEKYYGEDVVIQHNGTSPLKGKDENRKREMKFLAEIDVVHTTEIKSIAYGDDISMTEWAIDITPKVGKRKMVYRVNIQHWKEGKIVIERLYFCGE